MPSPHHLALAVATLAVAIGAALAAHTPLARDQDEWALYRGRFVTAEGRVVDRMNGGISHSEGQGYGMLLAVAYDDRPTFERLWAWTRAHLGRLDDALFAWRFDPRKSPPVTDRNSAADGDLLIAWALARAHDRWGQPEHRAAAEAIGRDLLAKLVRMDGGGPVLLPGPEGFIHDGATTVNLSYWIWPALEALAELVPSPLWRQLGARGEALLEHARFGRYGLPPDWLRLGPQLTPSPLFAPVYGYNAIRIPLHLVWGGLTRRELLEPFLGYAEIFGGVPPATVNLATGEVAQEPLPVGGQAILTLARSALAGRRAELPALDERMDYFSASLLLLAKVAMGERLGR